MKKIELSDKITELKQQAKTTGITYEMLSASSGIPIGTLKNIFSGATKNPRLDTVQAIERALSPDEFTPKEKAAGASASKMVSVNNPNEDILLHLFREIGEKKGAAGQEYAIRSLRLYLET